jgi:hypothetical protein
MNEEGKGQEGSLPFLREGYLISYSCKEKSWQKVELAPTERLSKEEHTQLDNIIVKLLDNGVLLNITYTPISEILGHPYESKDASISFPNQQH